MAVFYDCGIILWLWCTCTERVWWASGIISVEFCSCHWSLVFLALECPSLTGFFLKSACILSQALNFHTCRSHRGLLGTRKRQYFRKQWRIDLGEFWWIQLFLKDKKKIDFIYIDVGPGVVVMYSKELADYEQLQTRVGMHILYFVIGPS